MARLGGLYVDVHGDFGPLRRQAAVESAVVSRTFAQSFGRAQQRNLAALARTAKYATGIVTGLTVAMGTKAVKAGIDLNAQFESATAGIATFTGSMQAAERHIERLRNVSAQSPLRLTDYVEASRRLQGFGVEASKVVPLLDAVNKAVVATGGDAEILNRVTTALGQIQARGKVAAQEMLQLAEAGVPVQKILQRELGLTGEQIGNIGNEGIKAERALAAIARGWNREYAAAYRNASQTFNMQTAALTKNFEQVLRLSTEPLFEVFRDEWLPVLNETAQDIVKIWQRPGLTPEERYEQSFQAIRDGIGPLLEDVRQAIDDADLDDKLLEAFNDFIPKAAEAAGRGALKAVEAYATGFMQSGAWGKIVLGAILVRRMGLGPLFWNRQGAAAGAAYAAGFGGAAAPTTVAAGGLAAGGVRGRARGLLRGVGRFGLGAAGVSAAMGALADPSGRGLAGRIENAASAATFGLLPSVQEKQAQKFQEIADAIQAARGDHAKLNELSENWIPMLQRLGDLTDEQAGHLREMIGDEKFMARLSDWERRVRRSYDRAFDLGSVAQQFRSNLRTIRANFGRNTEETRDLTQRAKRAMVRQLQNLVENGRVSMKEARGFLRRFGLNVDALNPKVRRMSQNAKQQFAGVGEAAGELEGTFRRVNIKTRPIFKNVEDDARKLFAGVEDASDKADKRTRKKTDRMADGVADHMDRLADRVGGGIHALTSDLDAVLKDLGLAPVNWSVSKEGRKGRRQRKQRGGFIGIGKPSGDSVPALLERDEYVLNREAVRAIGKDTLDFLNFKFAPRFQKGGRVTGDIGGLVPEFLRALRAMSGAKGTPIFVQSGRRSRAQQAALYAAYLAGTGNLAAPPGSSRHEQGIAADITPGQGVFGNIAGRFGLGFTVPGEPWHIELLRAAAAGKFGAAPAQIARRVLQGPNGPLKDVGQEVLDRSVRAMRRYAAKKYGELGPDLGSGPAGALSEQRFMQLALQALRITGIFPATRENARKLLVLAKQESSLIPRSINNWDINAKMGNPSGGLMHLTRSNMRAYAHPRLGANMFNPLASIAASIRYQADRYGRLVTFSPYREGGAVDFAGWFAKGGTVTANRPTLLGIGERGRETATITRGDGAPVVHVHMRVVVKDRAIRPDAIKAEAEAVYLEHEGRDRRHRRMRKRANA